MAGFLKGGPRPGGKAPPKGASGFMSRSSSMMSMPHMSQPPAMPSGDGGKTEITHHPPGTMHPQTGEPISHSVKHSDGEETHHPSAGHMAAHLHAKHDGGEVGNMHSDGGKVTTHHVGPDGEVNGPEDHATPEEGANHLAMMMNGEDHGPDESEPDGDEGEAYT